MKIYDLRDDDDRIFAFEVPNTFLGRRGARRIVGAIPGARVLPATHHPDIGNSDQFCAFELGSNTFVVDEPFGDNSRYWIGANPPRWVPELSIVRDAFARAGLWGWSRAVSLTGR